MQKCVNLVDLAKSFQTGIYYLLAKFGFDTAEEGPLKVCQKLEKSQNKHRQKAITERVPMQGATMSKAIMSKATLPRAILPKASMGKAILAKRIT